ncbi:HORMA domain containing protein [Novymonas esmeraldas]|uniref:HORMA domain containing protein n=1 Tax=Novymonas esmeraldas TaxID=1808958 RepID=A0AAW0F7P4_9TRYP
MTSTVAAVNQTQSLAAIRNFVRASVSCITYARGLCSDNAFERRAFLGLPLRQLIPSTTESVAISEWIEKGAFDALNRNYLKEMSLCVYDAECRALLESYCFSFCYTGDGERAQMTLNASQTASPSGVLDGGASAHAQVSGGRAVTLPIPPRRRCTKQEVQRMLTNVLERLVDVVESLPPLLSERVLTMRLTYYDEVTPASYEPPCFAPASDHMARLYEEEVRHHVSIGSMDTSHHFFSIAIRHPLLQQFRSHGATAATPPDTLTLATPVYTARGDGAGDGATPSGPLRSGLASSCSSNPPAALAAVDAAASARSNSEPAAAGDVNAVAALDGVYVLVKECVRSEGRRVLKPAELVYVLLAALVLSKAPSARGGRGRISAAEAELYRVKHCPLEVPAESVHPMLQQLCSEGLLHAIDATDPFPRRARTAHVQDVAPPSTTVEWEVPDPPPSLLRCLLDVGQVTQLLTHDCHLALQELCVHLAREESRRAPRSAAQRRVAEVVGHVSTVESGRKRCAR